MPVPAHKVRRMVSVDRDLSVRLDALATATKTHQGRIVESALRTYWKESVMPSIIAWSYEADHHCCDCTEKRFGADVPESSRDNEGNPIHPVFSTDEQLSEGEDNRLPLVCGTCRAIVIPHPASQFDGPDVVADGGHGQYNNWEYADCVVTHFGSPFELDLECQKALQCHEWGHEELESVIERMNDWLALGTGGHCVAWSDVDPGVLLLVPVNGDESEGAEPEGAESGDWFESGPERVL